ncbi:hypothetical protein IKE13_01750 [Candidatus Saccharibacteria bacterium]|nr:hypothetical protein [Candidatus Saccharibacteria bacterium]
MLPSVDSATRQRNAIIAMELAMTFIVVSAFIAAAVANCPEQSLSPKMAGPRPCHFYSSVI